MAETKPTGEQIRFRSANTGEHVLDTYLESAEIGGRSLTDLLDDLFDPSNNGAFRTSNFEFRFDSATDKLQFRVGQFADSISGWSDLTTFFSIEGTFSTSTTYNNFDVVTLANKDVYIVHGLSSGTTFSSESNFTSSANTEKLVDVSGAQDWATKVNGIVDSTDYSSKAYAIGGTGVDTTTGSAKDWATKTSGTVGNTSENSAKYHATAAATSASTSTTQAALATTQASNSASSATASATSETNSASSASAASTSESNAAASAATAATQASLATTNGAAQVALATTQAGNAASSATAAAASQTSAAASAASAANSYDQFDDRYLGSLTGYSGNGTGPSVDNDGNALVEGALFFSADANEMRVFDSANWIAASSAGSASLILYEYTATSNQTTFSGSDDNSATLSYTVGNLQVVMNGVILDPSDFTATNGTSVVLASGAATGDLINIYAFKSFTTADMVSATNGGTFAGAVTFGGGANFGDNDKGIFGAGSDLQIFHDGSHSRIAEAGTGDLKIGTSGGAVRITANGVTDDMIVANQGGSVSLSHSGSTKLATTSTGVDITGDTAITGHASIGVDAIASTRALTVAGATDGSGSSILVCYNSSLSPKFSVRDDGLVSVAGDISFGDNDKAIFGAGSDFQIYHDGSNSFIDDAGTGNVFLRGSSQVIIGNMTGEQAAVFNDNGAVTINYDNAQKLATTGTGVDVTGTVQGDALVIDGNSVFNGNAFIDQGAISGNTLSLDRTGADGTLGFFNSGTQTGLISGVSGGGINAYVGSTPSLALAINASGSVGIGTSSPIAQSKLTVAGNSLSLTGSDANFGAGGVRGMLDLASGYLRMGAVNGGGSANGVKLITPFGGEAVVVDSSGRVTKPYQPSWNTQSINHNNASSGLTRVGSTDNGGSTNFTTQVGSSLSNGRFTAPVAGTYWVHVNGADSSAGNAGVRIVKNGSSTVSSTAYLYSVSYNGTGVSAAVYLNANEYVEGHFVHFNSVNSALYDGSFSGFLIG